jgi:Asp-tRNA(Asn)/Glu-tRNA(Gln) amidotransferase C subunit
MVSESEKESIRLEARGILDKFAKTLDKVKAPRQVNVRSHDLGTRLEKGSSNPDADFRKRMFANATHKDEDCIIAEKAHW